MKGELDRLEQRIGHLEASARRWRIACVAASTMALGLVFTSNPVAQQGDVLRVRGLIVEDTAGRARVVLGPLDPPPSTRGVGVRINDPAGNERLALYLTDSGRAGIGLDAPPGRGDDRNRERINLAADETGGAYIRFLDRRTLVAARTYLDEQNQVWMQFSDFSQKPAVIRRYGLKGEEVIRPPQ